MTDFDTNVANYTHTELFTIIGIENEDDYMDKDEIITTTNEFINKFENRKPEMSIFFKNVQKQLLQYISDKEEYEYDSDSDYDNSMPKETISEGFGNMSNKEDREKLVSEWYENEHLTQKDTNQANKITQRKQKIGFFDDHHNPMNREQIATTDTFNLPVKQDSLNPNLKNTIQRFVNIDSQFRQYTNGSDSTSTDYTLILSDTLKNALSIRLYSYQLPYSWYAIDNAYGNTCFWLVDNGSNTIVPISMPPGNYTQNSFVNQLNTSFQNAGITLNNYYYPPNSLYSDSSTNLPVTINSNSGKISLFLNNALYINPSNSSNTFAISSSTQIVFYDFTGTLHCNSSCGSNNKHFLNNTLGWLMGYRMPYVNVDPRGNTAPSILDLNGPKYLILTLDDYNQNHVNNSLVSITQNENTLKIPSYYSTDMPYTCLPASQGPSNAGQIISNNEIQLENSILNENLNSNGQGQNGLLFGGKYKQTFSYTPTQVVLPSAPRTLTNAQIYTINEINKNQNNLTNYLAKAPTSSDILAILPIKTSSNQVTGSVLVEFSGSLQDNTRIYFGPVNIDRMAVKLMDDKGNILNLNGNDWCFTMICECLYQY
jgi:hypothetical protein